MTVTVDKELIEAASATVDAGLAPSLSAWVNVALADRVAKERRLKALAEAITAYEGEFGTFSDAELIALEREDRRRALVVRSGGKKRRQRKIA